MWWWLLPVAHLPHSEFENGFPTGSESATKITVGERSNQTVPVIDHKEAFASFTHQFHKLVHNQIRFSANRKVVLIPHHILHLQFKFAIQIPIRQQQIRGKQMYMQGNGKMTLKMRLFPILPTGWFAAYSSLVRFLASMSTMATVSPKTIWIAVDVTGARLNGQSSLWRGKCTAMSHATASALPSTEVSALPWMG